MGRMNVKAAPNAKRRLRDWKVIARHQPQSAEGLAYAAVKAGIQRVVADSAHCGASQFRLRGDLHPVCRFKTGQDSRYRVLYIFSLEREISIVLYIGFRRAGDKRDAYADFERRLRGQEFDEQFREIGVKLPKAAGNR